MRSPWAAGLLMIVMGGIGLQGFAGQHPAGPVAYAIAVALIVGGTILIVRLPYAPQVALGAAALLAASGVLAALGFPRLAMPVPPVVSIVVGLYLCLRVAMTTPRRRRTPTEPPPI